MDSARVLLPPDLVHPHLVVLGKKSEVELRLVAARLRRLGIQFCPFYEPDLDGQLTALATEPLTDPRRQPLRRYQCWTAES